MQVKHFFNIQYSMNKYTKKSCDDIFLRLFNVYFIVLFFKSNSSLYYTYTYIFLLHLFIKLFIDGNLFIVFIFFII